MNKVIGGNSTSKIEVTLLYKKRKLVITSSRCSQFFFTCWILPVTLQGHHKTFGKYPVPCNPPPLSPYPPRVQPHHHSQESCNWSVFLREKSEQPKGHSHLNILIFQTVYLEFWTLSRTACTSKALPSHQTITPLPRGSCCRF